jgi:hypothetical protein
LVITKQAVSGLEKEMQEQSSEESQHAISAPEDDVSVDDLPTPAKVSKTSRGSKKHAKKSVTR